MNDSEIIARSPIPLDDGNFYPDCVLPYGLETAHIGAAMEEFMDFLGFMNKQLAEKGLPRLESFLMPANFSSIVGEFMNLRIPDH